MTADEGTGEERARELLRAMDAPMIPSNLAKAREAARRLDEEKEMNEW
jgi:hypothetical protein